MPLYEFECQKCKKKKEIFRHICQPKRQIKCKCGGVMTKIISLPNTDLTENPRWSKAMGVNIGQIEEAKRLYPDSVYNQKGDLLIKSRKHKLQEMRRRNMCELD